jgi:acetyl-CoA synthetase
MANKAAAKVAPQPSTPQTFAPPPSFSARAVVNSMQQYEALWQRAKDDPEGFWGELAREELHWFEPFAQVLDWK